MLVVVAGLAAGLVSALATPAFAALARRFGLVVSPRADRWHRQETPLLGGAAIALAFGVVLVLSLPLDRTTLVVLVCAAGAFALGLLDDFRHLAPSTKLVGQVMVASLLAFGGVRVELIEFAPVSYVVTVLWVVGIMNAFNLIDNMDGLAAGVGAIAGFALAVAATPSNPGAAILAAAVAGAAAGFLIHNFSPARVFMGDAGSLLIGFVLATAALLHTTAGAANLALAVLAPLAVLALPIFDTALVTTTRRLAGRPVSRGGRDHTSHRLAALGLSDRATVLLLYAVAAGFAALALAAEPVAGLVLPLFALAVIGLILFGSFLLEVDVYGDPAVPRPERSLLAQRLSVYGRFGGEIALDVALLTVAYYLAHVIRFEGVPEAAWQPLFVQTVPIVVGAQLAALVVFGAYRTLWRYLGISDAMNLVRALAVGTLIAGVVAFVLYRPLGYSRAVVLVDLFLAMILIVGARAFLVWLRHWFAQRPFAGERRVLIIGANDVGLLAVRVLGRSRETRFRAVGFVDDDPGKRYRRIGGVPVVGRTEDLEALLERLTVDLVMYAPDTPEEEERLDRSRETCLRLGVEWREFAVPSSRIRTVAP